MIARFRLTTPARPSPDDPSEPGRKTKPGGQGATDELPVGAQTQVWLATSDDQDAGVTGRYFKWRRDLRQPGRL